MVPFVPTVERVWLTLRDLRFERVDLENYVIHMGYDLWAESARESRAFWGSAVDRLNSTFFGVPVEVDRNVPRGWIALRHEVIR